MRRLRGTTTRPTERGSQSSASLTDGPGKICQALDISLKDNGTDLTGGRIFILDPALRTRVRIIRTPRIGISRAKEKLWRFTSEERNGRKK
jgi:DNA-3-methyladenine glycosylase